MARTTATNFTGELDFSYGTAATDLFKKEDIQTMALAVDQHDHSTGKGLVLGAGSFPSGSITSAMIADGTIATADIGLRQVTSQMSVQGSITSPSTTSSEFVDIPDMSITWTAVDGEQDLIFFQMACNVTAGGLGAFGFNASVNLPWPTAILGYAPPSPNIQTVHMSWLTEPLVPGTTQAKMSWLVQGGATFTGWLTYRQLGVVRLFR